MADDFETLSPGLTSPGSDVFPITPDDDNDLTKVTRAIRAGTGGDIVAVMLSGNTRTLKFADGETRAVRVRRVLVSGTTAGDMEGIV